MWTVTLMHSQKYSTNNWTWNAKTKNAFPKTKLYGIQFHLPQMKIANIANMVIDLWKEYLPSISCLHTMECHLEFTSRKLFSLSFRFYSLFRCKDDGCGSTVAMGRSPDTVSPVAVVGVSSSCSNCQSLSSCPPDKPCKIGGKCYRAVCNRRGKCWCNKYKYKPTPQ